MNGHCRFCGQVGEGLAFDQWVKPTFTDWDKLEPGDILCQDCAFWFEEKSDELTIRTGKDKPQRMRNYSHFIVNGQWTPLGKGDKLRMQELLLSGPFPELAVIAESGQKHIVFRAMRNQPGGKAGWVQFEEQRVWVDQIELRELLVLVEQLYELFGKAEIETGDYAGYKILRFGLPRWQDLESAIKRWRGKPIFALALFLAQRRDDGSGDETESGSPAGGDLERGPAGLQKPLPDDDLEPVRERDPQRGVHEQPGQVHQLTMFET